MRRMSDVFQNASNSIQYATSATIVDWLLLRLVYLSFFILLAAFHSNSKNQQRYSSLADEVKLQTEFSSILGTGKLAAVCAEHGCAYPHFLGQRGVVCESIAH